MTNTNLPKFCCTEEYGCNLVPGEYYLVRDADAQIAQLRGNLSLAEEGLASAMQELDAVTKDRDDLQEKYNDLVLSR